MARGLNQFTTPRPNLEHSPELSYILGVLKGDGSIYRTKSAHRYDHIIQLCVKDKEFLLEFNRCLEQVFSRRVKIIDCKNGFYKISIRSKSFYEWYKKTKEDELLDISVMHAASFIRGVFDSEGSLTKFTFKKNGKTYFTHCVRIVNSNLWLLEKIKEILKENYGIRSTISSRKVRKTIIDGRLCNFKNNIYVLGVYNKSGVERFLKTIGSSIPRKTYRR